MRRCLTYKKKKEIDSIRKRIDTEKVTSAGRLSRAWKPGTFSTTKAEGKAVTNSAKSPSRLPLGSYLLCTMYNLFELYITRWYTKFNSISGCN